MTAQEAQALVDQGVQQLLEDPDAWRQWATTYARFHQYSPGNVLLIMSQRPDASMVAGYHAWQALGRQVQKGEHGIAILAPVTKKEPDPEHPKEPPKARVVGFRAATVFDIAQTQGRELTLPNPKALTGHAMHDLLQHVIQSAIPVPVAFAQLTDAYGVWSPVERRIQIKADAEPDHQLKTLLHEWSHSLGVPDAQAAKTRHVGTEEVTAETTAYILAQSLGLDTKDYSQGYVAGWAQGDPKQVIAVQQEVGRRVHSITQALQAAAEHDPVLRQAQAVATWTPPKAAQQAEDLSMSR